MTQETIEVEDRLRFDEASLVTYLTANVKGFQGCIEVKKFGYGASNPTFHMKTSAGQQYVLRKKPPGNLIQGAHAIEREYRVLSALRDTPFPAPPVHVLCEDVSVIGTAFYVMDFIKGVISDNGLKKLEPSRRRPAMMAIVDTLASLHNQDPAALGLLKPGEEYGRMGGFYDRQVKTMNRISQTQFKNAKGAIPALEAAPTLQQLFAAHMPADRSCVIHGDYKADNVVLSDEEKPRVLTVLDWELSTIGHPLSDLANLCLPYHLGDLGALVNYGPFVVSNDSGVPSEAEVHEAYCKASGVTFPIPDWSFCVAFACYRLAVIVQGVAMRAALGQGSLKGGSQQSQGAAMMANELCNTGLRIMQEAYPSSSKL